MTWRLATALFLTGLPGVLAMVLALPMLVDPANLPLPLRTLQLATFVQSAVLLAAAATVGALLGDKVGLRAPVLAALCAGSGERRALLASLRPGAAGGMLGGVIGGVIGAAIIVGFHAGAPAELAATLGQHSLPLAVRLLYGGVTEEVLVRWGLMTLLAWAGWRLVQRRRGPVGGAVMWAAIGVSALIFGILHVPVVMASLSQATFGVVLHVTLGNALFGVMAGYLFWRRGLEAAITAHVLAHLLAYLLRG